METFALVSAIQANRFHIFGNKTIIHTDHSAITYISKHYLVDTKVFRWLHTFDMDIVCPKGIANSVADALNRYSLQNSEPGVSFPATSDSWLEDRFDQTYNNPAYFTCKATLKTNPVETKVIQAYKNPNEINTIINAQRRNLYFVRIIDFLQKKLTTKQ